jgi:molecular chaperone DnaK
MYTLGIDVGTTFTAAATWRDGHAEIVPLGSRSAAVPSVVLLREDETFLTGEAANRRGLTEPHRVAREFKRRMGDTTPLLLGGVPQSAEALTAQLLRSVIDEVVSREGGVPSAICVSYPANWGPYKTDLMRQAVRMADPPAPVTYTTEPEAAAVSYAQQQRIEPGSVVAVYDLGGGTFDAAVLRKTGVGFDILGQPEGIERLGGIDFDAAVFNHVRAALGGRLAELDEDDAAAVAAVARLREECVQAKEALSADTDTTIPVVLPNVVTDVRLTRSELEAMVRPVLHGSVEALQRAIRSTGQAPDSLHSVLLVGGSSRMPIVAQLVSSEFDLPVAVDAHPKHAVALGAAWLASGAADPAPAAPAPLPPPVVPASPFVIESGHLPRATFTGSARVGEPTGAVGIPARPVPPSPPTGGRRGGRGRRRMLVGAVVALAVLLGGGVAYAQYNRAGNGENKGAPGIIAGTSASAKPSEPALPADEQCTDEIKNNRRWACLTSAVIANGKLTLKYEVDYAGSKPNVETGYHVHFYGSDGKNPPDHIMGSQAPKSQRGIYYYDSHEPSILSVKDYRFTSAIGDAKKVCVRIAVAGHGLVPDAHSMFKTGNCWPITRP